MPDPASPPLTGPYSPPSARDQWIADVVELAEKLGVATTIFWRSKAEMEAAEDDVADLTAQLENLVGVPDEPRRVEIPQAD